MRGDEARILLGLPPDSRPNTSQVKEAYKKKVWESHPDLFPAHEKLQAESRFKLISEAYCCLLTENIERLDTEDAMPQIVTLSIRQRSGSSEPEVVFLSKDIESPKEVEYFFSLCQSCTHVKQATMDLKRLENDHGYRRRTRFCLRYTGVPRTNGGRTNHKLIGIPFLFIILGTIGLGGLNATRAYRKQKDAYPSHHPFLP